MSGEYSVAFVDLVNYLIPGALAFLVVFVLFRNELNKYVVQTETWILAALAISASYVAGMALHRIAAELEFPGTILQGLPRLSTFVESFVNYGEAKARLERILGFQVSNSIDVYLYAKSVVAQVAPSEAVVADRFIHLSQLSRSLVASMPVIGLASVVYLRRKGTNWRYVLLCVVLTIGLMLVFIRSWMVFKAAGVLTILRAFIVHTSLSG